MNRGMGLRSCIAQLDFEKKHDMSYHDYELKLGYFVSLHIQRAYNMFKIDFIYHALAFKLFNI